MIELFKDNAMMARMRATDQGEAEVAGWKAAHDQLMRRVVSMNAALREIERICNEENEHTGETWSSMITKIHNITRNALGGGDAP